MHSNQNKFSELVIDEIKKKTKETEVLVLFSYKNDLVEKIISELPEVKITLVATDNKDINHENVSRWAENPFKFIEVITDTKTKFDIVLVINPEYFFEDIQDEAYNLQELHKELIRDIQRNVLKESGILIFSTNKKGFILDSYVKPGADKLTKMVLSEEERKKSSFQAYAFYQ